MKNFVKRLFPQIALIFFLLFLDTDKVYPQQEFARYLDTKYHFSFQYPSNWKPWDSDLSPDMGDVRIWVGSPVLNSAMALVNHGNVKVARDFISGASDPKSKMRPLLDEMTERVHRKLSRKFKSKKMVVNIKKSYVSNTGLKFSISTALFFDKSPPMILSGTHIIPYESDYWISFLVTTYAGRKKKVETDQIEKTIRSFMLITTDPDG